MDTETNKLIRETYNIMHSWLVPQGFTLVSYEAFYTGFVKESEVSFIRDARLDYFYDKHRERMVCTTTGIIEVDDNLLQKIAILRDFTSMVTEVCQQIQKLVQVKERNAKIEQQRRLMERRSMGTER